MLACALLATTSGVSAAGGKNNRGVVVPGTEGAIIRGDRWAVVNRNATLARAKGVIRVTRGDTAQGSYVVKFTIDVTRCLYQATIGLSGAEGVEQPGEVTVVRRFNDPRAVYITTHDSFGTQVDRGFHLYVRCN
jgi:hypothetical protein